MALVLEHALGEYVRYVELRIGAYATFQLDAERFALHFEHDRDRVLARLLDVLAHFAAQPLSSHADLLLEGLLQWRHKRLAAGESGAREAAWRHEGFAARWQR